MNDKYTDFLDLFELPASKDEKPAPPGAPKPVDEPVGSAIPEPTRPSMFDGVLDDLRGPEQPDAEGRAGEAHAVPSEPEQVIEPEPTAWEPVPAEYAGPVEEKTAVEVFDPEDEAAPAQADPDVQSEADTENEFWPGEETPVEPAEGRAREADGIVVNMEEQGAIDPYQTREDAMDALVADVQASPNPKQCVVLAHSPEDKAQLEERLGDTPAQVDVVRPAVTKSRMPLLVGVGVALLAAGAIGWWTLSSNKESAEPTVAAPTNASPGPANDAQVASAPPAPPAVDVSSTPIVPAPASPQPVQVDPADLVADVVQPTPKPVQPTPPVDEPEPKAAPAPVVAKAASAPVAVPKPKAKPASKPAPTPAPEKSWQDDALNQLDELEKRL
ncbi:hypothetical protein [Pseudomonas sp. Hp2]|uniref:hypothetical protein n=1 Tax=Pseudomonas sp. Hp2 TaxID=701189 RepID=UPI00112BA9C3|nr:hypothetical protein [Pseudomonas sp. Hp2]